MAMEHQMPHSHKCGPNNCIHSCASSNLVYTIIAKDVVLVNMLSIKTKLLNV